MLLESQCATLMVPHNVSRPPAESAGRFRRSPVPLALPRTSDGIYPPQLLESGALSRHGGRAVCPWMTVWRADERAVSWNWGRCRIRLGCSP